jgi:hypothetical protein
MTRGRRRRSVHTCRSAPFLLPEIWRGTCQAVTTRTRADIHHAANRALGGESLLAIRVDYPTPWRRGHVHLSAPLGHEWLVVDVSPQCSRACRTALALP